MTAVAQRSARILTAAVIAISLAVGFAVLGSSHEVAPTAEPPTVVASSLAAESTASDEVSAHQVSSSDPGGFLLTCGVALLCLLALLIVAVSVRRRTGSWRAPSPELSRPVTRVPRAGSLTLPHLSGRLVC